MHAGHRDFKWAENFPDGGEMRYGWKSRCLMDLFQVSDTFKGREVVLLPLVFNENADETMMREEERVNKTGAGHDELPVNVLGIMDTCIFLTPHPIIFNYCNHCTIYDIWVLT
jgi:hypothetical protein